MKNLAERGPLTAQTCVEEELSAGWVRAPERYTFEDDAAEKLVSAEIYGPPAAIGDATHAARIQWSSGPMAIDSQKARQFSLHSILPGSRRIQITPPCTSLTTPQEIERCSNIESEP